MCKSMVTLKDIAARCGCSTATVSKALNGLPDISPQTAQRIRRIAEEMGYASNSTARTLRTNKSHVIGLLLFLRNENAFKHEYFSYIASGIQEISESSEYDLTLVTCRPQLSEQPDYLQYCRYRGYDGVIVMSGSFYDPQLSRLLKSNLPMVVIDYETQNRSTVISDNSCGIKELFSYVYGRGHRRIAYIHGEQSPVTQARLDSFMEACRENGVCIPPEYIRPAYYRDQKSCAQETAALLDLPEPPTCIFYPDDFAYIGGRDVILDRGLRIPEDVSCVGYDGIPMVQYLRPSLTTYRQNGERIGREACRELLKALEDPDSFTPQHILVPGSLCEGQSVSLLTESVFSESVRCADSRKI